MAKRKSLISRIIALTNVAGESEPIMDLVRRFARWHLRELARVRREMRNCQNCAGYKPCGFGSKNQCNDLSHWTQRKPRKAVRR